MCIVDFSWHFLCYLLNYKLLFENKLLMYKKNIKTFWSCEIVNWDSFSPLNIWLIHSLQPLHWHTSTSWYVSNLDLDNHLKLKTTINLDQIVPQIRPSYSPREEFIIWVKRTRDPELLLAENSRQIILVDNMVLLSPYTL